VPELQPIAVADVKRFDHFAAGAVIKSTVREDSVNIQQ
jgi:hypothetical protein